MLKLLLASACALMPVVSLASSVPAATPLADYRKYSEQGVQDWRAVNDTVAQRGGWRVYAREAHEAQQRERARSGGGQR